jgi:uncharacterized protein YnzC (UPF0291/DUF896 family)
MVTNIHFSAARQAKLYLKHAPLIEAGKIAGEHSNYGFQRRTPLKFRYCLEAPIKDSLFQDLLKLNHSLPSQIPTPELHRFSATISHSLVQLKPASLWNIAERGIVSPEHVLALSNFKIIPTSGISQASFNMILEYRNAKLPFKHQMLMARRFLPVSYLDWMVKEYALSRSSVMFFVAQKTFPHIAIKKALDVSIVLAEKYKDKGVTPADAWRFAVNKPNDSEAALLKAIEQADYLVKKYKDKNVTPSDVWRFAVSNPNDSEAALLKAIEQADYLVKKYKDKNVTYSDARRFAVSNPNDSEADLLKAIEQADYLAKKYNDKGITPADARRFAVYNSNNSEAALLKAIKKANYLAKKYKNKGITPSDAWFFAVFKPNNSEADLLKIIKKANYLARKYKNKGITPADARHFAVNHPDNSEADLLKAIESGEIGK